MEIKINQYEEKKLNKLFQQDEENKMLSDFNLQILYHSQEIAKNYDEKKSMMENIISFFKIEKEDLTFFNSLYSDLNFKLLDSLKYENNPYVKHIHLENISLQHYQFLKQNYEKNECFLIDEIKVDEKYKETTYFGYFKKPFSYSCLFDHQDIWMLITPHEINTMESAIKKAHGKVITYGLGLGYFAYMCSLKKEVSEIIIIEKNQKIIDLFKLHILPQFEYKEKITIICDDALNYIHTQTSFDFAFVDLYKDVDDGLIIYLKMLQASTNYPSTTFAFWIEQSMLIMLRRCLITLLYETYYHLYEESQETVYDTIISKFNELLKDTVITSFNQIMELLSDKSIKNLVLKMKL